MPTLASRERIRRTLERQPVDRIPNGLGGTETTGLHVLAYEKMKEIFSVSDPNCRMSTFMTTGLVEPPLLDAMGGDVILLASKLSPSRFWGPGARSEWHRETFWNTQVQVPTAWTFTHDPDGTIYWNGTDMKCPPEAIFFDAFPNPNRPPLNPRPSPDDYHPHDDYPDEYLRALEESAHWLYENTNYSICCGEMITDLQVAAGGVENWWMRLVEEPQAAHDFLGKAAEAGLKQIRLLDQAIGPYVDMMQIAHDMGDGRGITIGPRLWREIYLPHYKTLFGGWREITKMKIVLHCCGSVSDILGDLIDCGMQVFNPVQISGNNMDPASLKARFGDRLIFYGGVFDAIQTPPYTPAEVVYEKVKANLCALSQNGGYIFAAVHNIPGDTPREHLTAIMNALRDVQTDPTLTAPFSVS